MEKLTFHGFTGGLFCRADFSMFVPKSSKSALFSFTIS